MTPSSDGVTDACFVARVVASAGVPRPGVLAVHAHPDDESSKGAATMAKYAAQGIRTVLVTCTGGEAGDVTDTSVLDAGDLAATGDANLMRQFESWTTARRIASAIATQACAATPTGPFAITDPSDEVVENLVKILRN